ncbi:MAG: amino acid permease, partial [Rhodoferax sp.]
DPKRDMPRGILAGIFTLIFSAFMVLLLNPSIAGIGSHTLAKSGEPLLDGFKAIYGDGIAKALALVAVLGLIASFHTIIFAKGRQIYSLSRAGYFPSVFSITHGSRKTPHLAMIVGSVVALAVMFVLWFSLGSDKGAAVIGGTLLNMAVFGAMFSYIMQGLSFILLRKNMPDLPRPYRSPLGVFGAGLTVVIAVVTLYFQLSDPLYRTGVVWVAVWFGVCIAYFALVGRNRLILSPEEEFAMEMADKARK